METRTVYWIVVKYPDGRKHKQYLLPKEMHLIKTWLRDDYGADSVEVFKESMLKSDFIREFGEFA